MLAAAADACIIVPQPLAATGDPGDRERWEASAQLPKFWNRLSRA